MRVVLYSGVSALAGLLFGFDTVVISGAEQRIQALWGLSPAGHGIAVASALYGTVAGSMLGGWPTDRFGRKQTLCAVGVLYLLSALGSALANDVWTFALARLIGGVGIGVSTVVAPLYISEIAPARQRGLLAGLFQFNIVFGIVLAFASNSILASIGPNAWRWMLGVAALPSVLYTVLCFAIPESPRWLITRRHDQNGALAALTRIQPSASAEDIKAQVGSILQNSDSWAESSQFWGGSLRKPILLAFGIALFNQFSGINAVLYFAPRIFQMSGLGEQAALLQSIGVGVTNLAFTIAGLALVDRVGRRTLLCVGCLGYISSLGLIAWAFSVGHTSIIPACVFGFIAAHAIGQGTVIWVFISEIFPTEHRAQGQAFGSSTHWVIAALLTTCFPTLVTLFHPAVVFEFFCGAMVLQLAWVIFWVPETRGVSLEELERRLTSKHNRSARAPSTKSMTLP
jgi:MFS transporter, SP family, arabinose:H+ symporter